MTSETPGRTPTAWRFLRDAARTQLWPIPTLGIVVALLLGLILPRFDAAHDNAISDRFAFVFTGGGDSARSVLEAIAGSLITVTSLTFSLTVVTLQLASSQFSPRLLRTFTRDLVVQGTLGLFLATFTYALTVLRSVRTDSDGMGEFVPRVSVTVGFGLALASVIALVLFLAHLTRTIRVESMLDGVRRDALDTVTTELARSSTPPFPLDGLLPSRDLWWPVVAESSGFLVSVDEDALLRAAVEHDAVILLDCCPGSSVVTRVPIGAVWSSQPAVALDEPTREALSEAVRDSLRTGFERTATQDVSLGLRQLTDVALKALSPGINDPTTAVHALSHSSALLVEMADRELGPLVLRDDDGVARVVLVRPDLAELLDLAVAQPAGYARDAPAVLHRLFLLLTELAWTCRAHQRGAVGTHLTRLRRVAASGDLDPSDRVSLEAAADRAQAALDGVWTFRGDLAP